MSQPPSPMRILVVVKRQKSEQAWREAWGDPGKLITRALRHLKHDELISPDHEYNAPNCRFMADLNPEANDRLPRKGPAVIKVIPRGAILFWLVSDSAREELPGMLITREQRQKMEKPPRRTHRKSRAGCGECKRRRVKCDEIRPACGNCTKTGLDCPYSSSPNLGRASSSDATTASHAGPSDIQTLPARGSASMMQLQLLHHFMCDEAILPRRLGSKLGPAVLPAKLVEMGTQCEYLMTEILAFSAVHLAHTQPGQRSMYLEQAGLFHSRAITLFSSVRVDSDAPMLLHIVFFSWLVGAYLLCDLALADVEQTTLLPCFIQFIEVYRGVRPLTLTAWHDLREPDDRGLLGEYLKEGVVTANRRGRGEQTALVKTLIHESLGLGEQAKRECSEALSLIQSIIDIRLDPSAGEDGEAACVQMCFTWPVIVGRDFLDAAKQRRPEPLFVLAFYAVMLHWCKGIWLFGNTGRRLLDSIVLCVGPGWERWLQWPTSVMESEGSIF